MSAHLYPAIHPYPHSVDLDRLKYSSNDALIDLSSKMMEVGAPCNIYEFTVEEVEELMEQLDPSDAAQKEAYEWLQRRIKQAEDGYVYISIEEP